MGTINREKKGINYRSMGHRLRHDTKIGKINLKSAGRRERKQKAHTQKVQDFDSAKPTNSTAKPQKESTFKKVSSA